MRTLAALLSLPALLTMAACSGAPLENTGDTSGSEDGEQALTSNEKTAYQFFIGKGLTHAQAAGVVGNLIQESSVLPNAVQYGGGPGRGIAQWSVGGRWNNDYHDNVVWYAGTHGGSPWSLQTQLDFIWYELQTFSRYGLARLRAAGNLTDAVVAFQDDFEACGTCAQSTRIKYAQQVLAAYGGGGGGGGGGNNGNSCYSSTLGMTMPENACVQSRFNKLWYQCDQGSWVDRWSDPTPCNGVHPL